MNNVNRTDSYSPEVFTLNPDNPPHPTLNFLPNRPDKRPAPRAGEMSNTANPAPTAPTRA